MDEDDDFQRRTIDFVAWLGQNDKTISSKIELVDLRKQSAGRGVVAQDDIDEDEELFSIPRSSILTVEASSLPTEIQCQLGDPWLSLILAMIYEYQQGSASTWKPYFDVLPIHFDTLMYWSEDELHYLKGSAVIDKIGKTSANKNFIEQILPVVREHHALFDVEEFSDEQLLALCHRMGSTIMAYAFDLERASNTTAQDDWEEASDDGEALPKGMIPLADMLNADADRNNAKLFYEDDRVVMKAIKSVKKGEELFNDYGPLPRADLLRRYGYITDNYAQYDVVEVSLDLVKETAKKELKMKAQDIQTRLEYLDEQSVLDDGFDMYRASHSEGQFPDELKVLLNTAVMPKAEFDKLKKKEKLPKPVLTKEALHLLYNILVRRRSMYRSTEAKTSAPIIPEFMNGNDVFHVERRKDMAAQVIEGEKVVLEQAAETVQQMLGSNNKRKADTFDNDVERLQISKRAREEAG